MKIALAQMEIGEDIEKNFQKTIEFIKQASKNGADLIAFPEIHLTPFFPQYSDLNPEEYIIGKKYLDRICEVCRKYEIYAAPNFYIEENTKKYDRSFLIDSSGNVIGTQDMIHIAQAEKFYEQSYYESGNGFNVFDTEFGKIGIVVCFDRHYPESIRTESLKGAELIIIPTANTLAEPTEMFMWEIKVQAFQNSVNIAMINRVGREDEMEFSGESIVCDFNGKTLSLGSNVEEIIYCDVDLAKSSINKAQKPYLSLRKKQFYE